MQVKRKFIIIAILQFIEAAICGLFPLISFFVVLLLPYYPAQQNDTIFLVMLSIVGVPTGILSIIGGTYSLKRRKWKLVLASSLAIYLPAIILLLFFITEISDAITTLSYSSIEIWYVIRNLDFWFIIPIAIAITNLLLVIKAKKYFNIPTQESSEVSIKQSNAGIKKLSKKIVIILIAFLALLAIVLGIYSTNQDQPPYKYISFNKGVNFSFEYPTHYYLDAIHKFIPEKYSGGLHFLERKAECGGLSITVGDSSQDAESAAADLILHAYDFERFYVEINGVHGEVVVCHWESGGEETCARPVTIRTVYFNYNGLLWEIELFSMDDNEAQSKNDFEWIIQTFKIWDGYE